MDAAQGVPVSTVEIIPYFASFVILLLFSGAPRRETEEDSPATWSTTGCSPLCASIWRDPSQRSLTVARRVFLLCRRIHTRLEGPAGLIPALPDWTGALLPP